MTTIRVTALLLLLTLFAACSKPAPEAVAPAPSAQSQQALSWLTAPTRWLVDEARENNTLLFKRGVHQLGDGDMTIEWIRFLPNGRFEAKLQQEATLTVLHYKLDDATRQLLLQPAATSPAKQLGSAAFAQINQQQVVMQMNEGTNDQLTLTLVPQP